MATIRKRDSKWQVQVRRQGFKPVSRSFIQQRDAERWATLKERELDLLESQGLQGATVCNLTLAELLARYRSEVIPSKRGGDREAYIVQAFERLPLAKRLAGKLAPSDFRAHRDKRLSLVGPATVVRELGIVQHAYEVARTDWGFTGLSNPLKDVPKPKLPGGRTRRLVGDELAKLTAQTANSRNHLLKPLMVFALETAMRQGEIITARWEHLQVVERVLVLPMTKNGKPRTVPLTKTAMQVLSDLGPQTEGPIFPTTSEAVKTAWARLTKRAKVPDFHFHDLRHEAISRLFERGFDLPEVMMMSGHTDHRMLLRYTHLHARKLVEKLDRL